MLLIRPAHFYLPVILLLLLGITPILAQQSWTHFRGNQLDGIAEVASCPVKWTPDSAIVWKTAIHGRAWSSPVVLKNQVWMTNATTDGNEMSAVCVDFLSGKILQDVVIFRPASIESKHDINSYATPTPCIEDDFVYVHFGQYGTACLRTADASVVWQRSDMYCKHVQGPGSSPVIYKNLLLLHLEGTDRQRIIALDKATGATVWETERPAEFYSKLEPIGKKAYITPIIVNVNGRDLMISNGSAVCIAYDPMTGKEVWRIVQGEDSTIAMPLTDGSLVYFYTGFVTVGENDRYAELFAVDPSGNGDVTSTHIRWRMKAPILQLSTPIVKDGLLYTIDTKNMMMCIEASSGAIVWSNRAKGKFNSSPIFAAGNIYFCSTTGETTVIKAGREYVKMAVNKLDGEIWTTPVAIDNSLLIRTSEYLYKIQ
ncbi:MAG: PQQ-binding-like beta-propeller repeat protein [Cyclobacteriaceae bacterium]|nr:PQQ-binding-like beta-propeller repeat protein [Cyclobacteriaceae bacterium]